MKVRNLRDVTVAVDPRGHDSIVVGPGETVDVPDEVGKSLLEQPARWAESKSKTKAGKSGEESES